MTDSLYFFATDVLKRAFPKYRLIQVGSHLKKVSVKQKQLVKEKRIFGIRTKAEYECKEQTIGLTEYTKVYDRQLFFKRNVHLIYIAPDDVNKIIYWNYAGLPDEEI